MANLKEIIEQWFYSNDENFIIYEEDIPKELERTITIIKGIMPKLKEKLLMNINGSSLVKDIYESNVQIAMMTVQTILNLMEENFDNLLKEAET